MPGHTKCCTFRAKSSSQNWRSDAPKCNPSQEISVLTSKQLWWTCLLYYACHGKSIFADPLQMPHACHRFWKCCKTFTFCSLLTRCTIPCACHAKRHLNVQKLSEHVVFLTFWLGNSFAPQQCALFRHLNFQECSEPVSFLHFWLRNVLRATTTCTFSTSQLPKVVRTWCVLYILTWKCASRHNGVQFFISHLASWLRTRRFSEPTFRPSGVRSHKSLEKHSVSRLSYLFAHLDLLSSDSFSFFFSSLALPTSAFHLSILSEVWLLNFLRSYNSYMFWIVLVYFCFILFPCLSLFKIPINPLAGHKCLQVSRVSGKSMSWSSNSIPARAVTPWSASSSSSTGKPFKNCQAVCTEAGTKTWKHSEGDDICDMSACQNWLCDSVCIQISKDKGTNSHNWSENYLKHWSNCIGQCHISVWNTWNTWNARKGLQPNLVWGFQHFCSMMQLDLSAQLPRKLRSHQSPKLQTSHQLRHSEVQAWPVQTNDMKVNVCISIWSRIHSWAESEKYCAESYPMPCSKGGPLKLCI